MEINTIFNKEEDVTFENYMKECGIDDIDKFIKACTLEESYNYDNMKEARELLEKYSHSTIRILADSDLDGYMSASMAVVFCKENYPYMDIIPMFHHNQPKAHGLQDKSIMIQLGKAEPTLLWIPDAGTSDVTACKKLTEKGFEILVTDHHQPNCDNPYATIINNQISNVNNKHGSGCLVTWHLLSYINPKLANKLISYVMLSLIGDSMDMSDYENHTFCYRGKNKIHENLVDIIDEFNKGKSNRDYSFGCVTRINSVIRMGELKDKIDLFNCLIGESNSTYMLSRMKDLHSFQKYEVDRLISEIEIDNSKPYILAKINEKTALTGLVANKIMSTYNKPTILVHNDDKLISGSVRSNMDNFRSVLNDSNLFEFNSGHEKVFGTAYRPEKENEIIDYLNSLVYNSSAIDVMCSCNWRNVYKNIFNIKDKVDKYDIGGYGMATTKVHIKPFINNGNCIARLGNGSTLKIHTEEYDILFFFMGEDKREQLYVGKNHEYRLEIIGEPSLNVYNGKITPQIIVDSFEVHEKEDLSWEDTF